MTPPKRDRRKERSLSKVVIPLITLGLLLLFWRYNLKWMTLPVIGFLLFYYLLLPRIVRSQVERFHRKAILLLTSGRAKEVPRLVKRSILLQLFGPSASIDAKLGLAYLQCDAYELARSCLDNAIPSAPPTERPALQTGLVKALFVTGDLARAEAEGRSVLDRVTRLPELLVLVARARIGLGKADDTTRKMLDEAEALSRSEDITLMVSLSRIELALATGRKPDELPEKADSDQAFLRAWIHLVRGLLRQRKGSAAKAEKSFRKAVEILPDSIISAVAGEQLGQLQESDVQPESKGKDPAVRRKRKRRR